MAGTYLWDALPDSITHADQKFFNYFVKPPFNYCAGRAGKNNRLSFLKNISSHTGSDAELLQRYRNTGNLQVLGALYQRYMDLVYGVCLKYLEDTEKSRDAVMQLFEMLIESLKKHEVENFKSWLYTVAKNHCLMELRRNKKNKWVPVDSDLVQKGSEMHLNGEWQREAEFKRLEQCLQTLSPEQQQVVTLFYLKQQCYNQIATSTGLEWKQVRSHIQNGRRNLKICMDRNAGITG